MHAGGNKPVIGITGFPAVGRSWSQEIASQQGDVLIQDYPLSVEAAGGLPVGLPLPESLQTMAELVTRLDGLILSGGVDLHPRMYGEEPRPGLGDTNYHQDQMNRAALLAAMEAGIPVLGICRGHQLMCAALGGGLYQDLPTQRPDCLDHVQKASPREAAHQVEVAPGSLLDSILGERRLWVNSHHHQAVKELPEGFTASAHASDGVVEAMEHPGHRFLLSVQWHPEGTALAGDQASQRIFRALVAAASRP